MNLTVGPHPPVVYWRRRAIVLGGLLLVIILLASTCGGSDKSNAAGGPKTGAKTHSGSPSASPDPSPTLQSPIIGSGPLPSTTAVPTGSVASAPSTIVVPPPTPSDFCSDAEMQLTPGFRQITGGTVPYQLTLKIKNISNRTCKRDIGADPQEMHIVQNGQTKWSSDSCQTGHGAPSVRSFPPGIEDSFAIGWDGTFGADCAGGSPAGPGTYQVIAKLATDASKPVAFKLPTGGLGS
jgi:hypothetical protein